jgi:digeranylgeranylglycerophospholipid reductase
LKTAILGSGLSGLACALALEQNGMEYELFDKMHVYGEHYQYASCTLKDTARGIDWLKQVKSDTGIEIQPLSEVNRIVLHSGDRIHEYAGNFGWLLEHGQGKNALAEQIVCQLTQTPQYSTYADWAYLRKTYDIVVMCGMAGTLSVHTGDWDAYKPVFIRGATVLGSFDEHSISITSNKEYCPDGVLYRIPLSRSKAMLALCLTNITPEELAPHWEAFLKEEDMRLEVIEEFETVHHAGTPRSNSNGNMWFAECGAGFFDPFLGWGPLTSIAEGYRIGSCISKGMDPAAGLRSLPYRKDLTRVLQPLELLKRIQE